MPGMSGLELQQQLNLRGAVLPVIFMTGHGDIPMAVEAMQHGAFDFLQKPFRDQDLLDRIQRAIVKDTERRTALGEHARIQRASRHAHRARTRSARPHDAGQAEQGHCAGPRSEPTHRGDPSRTRHGKDERAVSGASWCA